MRLFTTMKTFTIVAALLASGTALAIAQNGLPTGGETPVAGGANGGGAAGQVRGLLDNLAWVASFEVLRST
jgi:hypothetical protein